MAITGKSTESGAAAYVDNATPTTLLTASLSANKIIRISKLILVNINAASRTVQIYKVASGGSISGDDWKVVNDLVLAAEGYEDVRELAGCHLENGDSLRVLASAASSVRFNLDYWEES